MSNNKIKFKNYKNKRNKYLDLLDIKEEDYEYNFCNNPNDKRQELWKKERDIYGFDSRETWNMDVAFIEWLYSHISMFKEKACIDFSEEFEYKGNTYTYESAIDFILESLSLYLIVIVRDDNRLSEDGVFACNQVIKALHLFSDIYYYFWW